MRFTTVILLLAVIFTGCASRKSLQRQIDSLKRTVEDNHQDAHADDKKLSEAIQMLADRLHSRTVDLLDRETQTRTRVGVLEEFWTAHDKRWPQKAKPSSKFTPNDYRSHK